MLALGFSLESLLTLLTIRGVPFLMVPWVVINVSVAVLPIQVQNHLYRYGYAMPFYNVSRAVRTIIFGTKNECESLVYLGLVSPDLTILQ